MTSAAVTLQSYEQHSVNNKLLLPNLSYLTLSRHTHFEDQSTRCTIDSLWSSR